MIPLRVITRDAFVEYGWSTLPIILPWYRPYFELAVQTGLRPSEQVALKWQAVDKKFIHIELSRVRNMEKTELKTEESRRRIAILPLYSKPNKKMRKHFL